LFVKIQAARVESIALSDQEAQRSRGGADDRLRICPQHLVEKLAIDGPEVDGGLEIGVDQIGEAGLFTVEAA